MVYSGPLSGRARRRGPLSGRAKAAEPPNQTKTSKAAEPPNQTKTSGASRGFTMPGLSTYAPVEKQAELATSSLPQMATGFLDASGARVEGGSGGGDPAPKPTPTPGNNIDTSAPEYRDAEYNAQIASLNKALQDYETGAQQRADRYGQDFRTGVQQMGYRPTGPSGFGDILAEQDPNAVQAVGGQWDLEGQYDPYSAAAKGTRGLRDDFAARGTLRSSDFGQTFGEFQDRLDDQLTSMNLAKARFGENLQSDLASQRSNTEERRQATRRTAQQRAMSNQMVAIQRAMAGG